MRWVSRKRVGMVEEDHKSRWHREWKRNDTVLGRIGYSVGDVFLYPKSRQIPTQHKFSAEKEEKVIFPTLEEMKK